MHVSGSQQNQTSKYSQRSTLGPRIPTKSFVQSGSYSSVRFDPGTISSGAGEGMDVERGLSPKTIESVRQSLRKFFQHTKAKQLIKLRIRDIKRYLIFLGKKGWTRAGIRGRAHHLRMFFRYGVPPGDLADYNLCGLWNAVIRAGSGRDFWGPHK